MARTKLCSFFLLLAVVHSSSAQLTVPSQWQSELYADHELVGQIWDSSVDTFVSVEEIANRSLAASYLLLGEKHDNPDHHALQLAFVNLLLNNNKLKQLVFEMMNTDSQSLLDRIQQQQFDNGNDLKAYLNWDEEGWDWEFYGPLIEAGYDAEVALAAGNITNARMGEVYGFESLPVEFDVLGESTIAQLYVDIDESHCGLLPESQFPAMVRVQQARDFSMASSMEATDSNSTVVLITGNYHARKDLGVPNYLVARDKNLSMEDIISIGFMEVQPGENNPETYLQRYGEVAAYDYIWFTPMISEQDYCASLRQ
ncbi:MAG: ChaN family lipoprotein [Pseudohongiellaceae bacterium]